MMLIVAVVVPVLRARHIRGFGTAASDKRHPAAVIPVHDAPVIRECSVAAASLRAGSPDS